MKTSCQSPPTVLGDVAVGLAAPPGLQMFAASRGDVQHLIHQEVVDRGSGPTRGLTAGIEPCLLAVTGGLIAQRRQQMLVGEGRREEVSGSMDDRSDRSPPGVAAASTRPTSSTPLGTAPSPSAFRAMARDPRAGRDAAETTPALFSLGDGSYPLRRRARVRRIWNQSTLQGAEDRPGGDPTSPPNGCCAPRMQGDLYGRGQCPPSAGSARPTVPRTESQHDVLRNGERPGRSRPPVPCTQ